MCSSSILDNEGVWSKRRTHEYSWKTPKDHIHHTLVTHLPGFHLQHPDQGRDVHSTPHNAALPRLAASHRQSEHPTPQHSKGRNLLELFPASLVLYFEKRSPLRAMYKSSLAPWANCKQVLASFLVAAAVLKARYASKQACYWQQHVSLAQPALLHSGLMSKH